MFEIPTRILKITIYDKTEHHSNREIHIDNIGRFNQEELNWIASRLQSANIILNGVVDETSKEETEKTQDA